MRQIPLSESRNFVSNCRRNKSVKKCAGSAVMRLVTNVSKWMWCVKSIIASRIEWSGSIKWQKLENTSTTKVYLSKCNYILSLILYHFLQSVRLLYLSSIHKNIYIKNSFIFMSYWWWICVGLYNYLFNGSLKGRKTIFLHATLFFLKDNKWILYFMRLVTERTVMCYIYIITLL